MSRKRILERREINEVKMPEGAVAGCTGGDRVLSANRLRIDAHT